MNIEKEVQELQDTVLAPLRKTKPAFMVAMAVLAALFLWGAYSFAMQVIYGLGVTGMNRPVYWGVYLTNFVFFIGISHAGTLISAILRVTQAEWRRPITRVAEAITFFALILGLLQVWIDMGRPERFFYPFIWGRYYSPFLWDFTSIGVYVLSSSVYLYLPMVPDLAYLRDHMTDAPKWRRMLYTFMAMGWRGTREQIRRLEVGIGIVAILIIPIAVSVHTVVSWIFGMTMQPMWHTTILGPYFVVGAIFSGIATLFIFMTIARKIWHLEKYITIKQYNYLGVLLLVMSAFWFYFTMAEYITVGYATIVHELEVWDAKVLLEFSPLFWVMFVGNFFVPFAVLLWRKGRTPVGTTIAAAAIVTGMWVERYMIVVPSLTRPSLGLDPVTYTPTMVEISITIGSFALFSFMFFMFFKLFPAISAWEVVEGMEIAEANRLAKEMLEKGMHPPKEQPTPEAA